MDYKVEIPTNTIKETFQKALASPVEHRGNFFHEVRQAFKHQIERLLLAHGIETSPSLRLGKTYYLKKGKSFYLSSIPKSLKYHEELDINFCAGYGHEDYSLEALNYTRPSLCELPSLLPFLKKEIFPIGNILIFVENRNYDLELIPQEGINLVGYSYDISLRKAKSYLCLFGVWFQPAIITSAVHEYAKDCKHNEIDLDEIQVRTNFYPILFICRKCGQLFTCSCFENYFDIQYDLLRRLSHENRDDELWKHLENIQIKNNICHLCTGNIPKLEYGHRMYYSLFMQRYLPYYHLLSRKEYGCSIHNNPELSRPIEDKLRETFGYPKVGEKWLSETMLYKIVDTLLPSNQVIHHYRGEELEGLELDIWIPELKLGIEYQGEQHYKPIEHWGGEKGLKERQQNDRKKRRICKQLEYNLVEFRYGDSLTEESVRRMLSKFII